MKKTFSELMPGFAARGSSRVQRLIVLTLTLALLSGCGGGSQSASRDDTDAEETSATEESVSAVATMPAASFSSVGEQSGLTETVSSETTETVETEDAPDLALGERVYGNHCAECHGANAEGGSDSALTNLTLEKVSFIDLLRTGGDLGPEHLYGNQKISERGVEGLFDYLASLQ